jgi:hypothetical protein
MCRTVSAVRQMEMSALTELHAALESAVIPGNGWIGGKLRKGKN